MAAPVKTYASAIALDELAIAATAGAHPSPPRVIVIEASNLTLGRSLWRMNDRKTKDTKVSMVVKGDYTFLLILGGHVQGILFRCRDRGGIKERTLIIFEIQLLCGVNLLLAWSGVTSFASRDIHMEAFKILTQSQPSDEYNGITRHPRMASKKKCVKLKSLSHGRPPMAKPPPSISRKATRGLIRSHHTLQKHRAKALENGDGATAAALSQQIESQGGIESYQSASLLGQASDRGGDSSKILMEWLAPFLPAMKEEATIGQPIRMLEVGALSVMNACSKSGLFEVERIDLHSQADGIKQQDFMERPLPRDGNDQFDIISLSLVLNFVADAPGRGNMLQQTLKFLRLRQYSTDLKTFVPSLFLVLPAPCVTNSRYLDESRLQSIMESLGYVNVKKKLSKKLVYYLWRLESIILKGETSFKKEEIRSGKTRNNFAIVLR